MESWTARSFYFFSAACFVVMAVHRSSAHFASPAVDGILNREACADFLAPGDTREVLGSGSAGLKEFRVFCFPGFPFVSPQHVFTSVKLKLQTNDTEPQAFVGKNSSAVHEEYDAAQGWFSTPKLLDWGPPYNLRLYEESCIGINSLPPYIVTLYHQRVDFLRLIVFVCGLLVFFKARMLCVNSCVYYGSGIGIGIVCSLIVLVFFVGRRMTRKSLGLAVIVGGWSFALYVLNMARDNFVSMVTAYSALFGMYCVTCALLTFFLMYRYQPMRHPRSIDILEWVLQGLGAVMIFGSTDVKEFSTLTVMVSLAWRYFPSSWSVAILKWFNAYRYRYVWLRPKHRYLTEQEYIDEANHETKRALGKLRDYCASPDCNAWRTVNKLKNPKRFAKFVDSGHHIEDSEILAYDCFEPQTPDFESDEELNVGIRADVTDTQDVPVSRPSTSRAANKLSARKCLNVANRPSPSTSSFVSVCNSSSFSSFEVARTPSQITALRSRAGSSAKACVSLSSTGLSRDGGGSNDLMTEDSLEEVPPLSRYAEKFGAG